MADEIFVPPEQIEAIVVPAEVNDQFIPLTEEQLVVLVPPLEDVLILPVEVDEFTILRLDPGEPGAKGTAGNQGPAGDDAPTDHGLLTGLGDLDHSGYLPTKTAGGTAAETPTHTHASAAQAGTVSHDVLTGVSIDDHHTENHNNAQHVTGVAPTDSDFADVADEGVSTATARADHLHGREINPVTAHLADTLDAHDASAISILDAALDFTATDVEGALAELQADAEADATALADHLADAADAHDASAISFVAGGSIAGVDVQTAIAEVATDYIAADAAHVAAADPHTGYLLLAGRAGGQTAIGGTGSGDDLTLESTSHATKGMIAFSDVAHFHGALDEAAESHDRVSIGIASGTPRLLFEDGASATLWEIDNSAGVLRFFNPGTLRAQLSTTTFTIGPSSAVDTLTSGYLRVGSVSAPSNTTAGDITGTRLHVGTDGVFTSGVSFEVNAARGAFGGAITGVGLSIGYALTSAAGSMALLAVDGSLIGAGEDAAGMNLAPSLTPSASISNAYGLRNRPAFSIGSTLTITNAYGQHIVLITGTGAGAITTLYGQLISAFYQTIKPTNAYGLSVQNMGSASIGTAVGVQIIKPTAATNNYYADFDTNNAAALGAYQGKLPVLVGGAAGFIPWYL